MVSKKSCLTPIYYVPNQIGRLTYRDPENDIINTKPQVTKEEPIRSVKVLEQMRALQSMVKLHIGQRVCALIRMTECALAQSLNSIIKL